METNGKAKEGRSREVRPLHNNVDATPTYFTPIGCQVNWCQQLWDRRSQRVTRFRGNLANRQSGKNIRGHPHDTGDVY